MSAAIGTLGKFGIGTANPTTYAIDFKREGLKLRQDSVNGNGVRGSLSHSVERVRAGPKRIEGPISMEPNAADLHQLFPWFFGLASSVVSGTNKLYGIANPCLTRFVQFDRHAKVFTYSTCAADKVVFRCEQGKLLECDVDVVAGDVTVGNAGTFPVLEVDTTTNPFILSDLSLSVNGTGSVTAKGFELSVNNNIDKDRFFNSLTITEMVKRDREVRFKVTLPYGDWTSLYALGAATGIAVTVTLTNGTSVLLFSMPKVVFPPIDPSVEGRTEVMLELEGRAYRYGTSTTVAQNELITNLDTGA